MFWSQGGVRIFPQGQWFPQPRDCTHCIRSAWERVRNTNSQAPPQTTESDIREGAKHLQLSRDKSLPGDWCWRTAALGDSWIKKGTFLKDYSYNRVEWGLERWMPRLKQGMEWTLSAHPPPPHTLQISLLSWGNCQSPPLTPGSNGGTNHRIYQPQWLPRGREPDSSWANQNIPTPPGYSNWLKTGQKSFSGIFSTGPGRKLFPLWQQSWEDVSPEPPTAIYLMCGRSQSATGEWSQHAEKNR